MIDIAAQIGAIDRTVERRRRDDGGEDVTVVARRAYDAAATDIWNALTDPERVARWFMPSAATCERAAASSSRATQAATFSSARRRAATA
ncbi:SRPBCC domain-containing protein [Georgenia ruanii]|uniref:SRPBCC domain-containing protein n=1 Tax=Georgenia ruanii TaxID=348442 RepID=UPI001D00739A|nr:SRPBCC domain-containing protein [Georgenia ruanii]